MARLDARSLKDFWVDEVPSGTINGVNTSFTLSQLPLENEAVDVYIDGLLQAEGVDYTLSGSALTISPAPAIGQSVLVNYIREKGE